MIRTSIKGKMKVFQTIEPTFRASKDLRTTENASAGNIEATWNYQGRKGNMTRQISQEYFSIAPINKY